MFDVNYYNFFEKAIYTLISFYFVNIIFFNCLIVVQKNFYDNVNVLTTYSQSSDNNFYGF